MDDDSFDEGMDDVGNYEAGKPRVARINNSILPKGAAARRDATAARPSPKLPHHKDQGDIDFNRPSSLTETQVKKIMAGQRAGGFDPPHPVDGDGNSPGEETEPLQSPESATRETMRLKAMRDARLRDTDDAIDEEVGALHDIMDKRQANSRNGAPSAAASAAGKALRAHRKS